MNAIRIVLAALLIVATATAKADPASCYTQAMAATPYKGMVMVITAVTSQTVKGEDTLGQGDGAKRYDFTYSYQGQIKGSTWTVGPKDGWGIIRKGDTFAWVLDSRMTDIRGEAQYSPMVFPAKDCGDPIKVDASSSADEVPL